MNEIKFGNKGSLESILLSRFQRLQILIFRRIKSREIKKDGWSKALQFYYFKCPEHGIVENHPKGYGNKLNCPHCVSSFSYGCLPDSVYTPFS